MPIAATTPTTTARRKPSAASWNVTSVCPSTIQCLSRIVATICHGEGTSQSGMRKSRTASSHTRISPTKNAAPRTMREVGTRSRIRLFLPEPPANAAGQARERGRVLHEDVPKPRQVHGHDVDDPPRPGGHDDHAVREHDRLDDVVGHEGHRALPPLPSA